MKISKKLRRVFLELWEPTIGSIIALTLVGGLLAYRLGTLVPSYSLIEKSNIASSSSAGQISSNPLNGPYKAAQWLISVSGHTNPMLTRLVSALLGLAAVVLFYYVVSRWTASVYIAILSTALFVSSSWFLHYARLASPDIFLITLLGAIAYGTWLRKTQRPILVVFYGAIISASMVYIPGLIWFLIVGGLWQRKTITTHLKEVKLTLLPVAAFAVLLFTPLVLAFTRNPELIKTWLGLPSSWPVPYEVIRHILNVPFQVFFRGPDDPTVWLGRLPLLDLFVATMSILGAYSFFLVRSLDRTKLIAGSIVVGTLLVGLRGSVSSIVLMPFMYLLAAAGIAYMVKLWFSVFPHNPLARVIAVTLITAAVVLSCLYNLRHYFVAWPGSPATKQTFTHRPS